MRTKEMDMTFGHLTELPTTRADKFALKEKDESMGKALIIDQPHKKTRF